MELIDKTVGRENLPQTVELNGLIQAVLQSEMVSTQNRCLNRQTFFLQSLTNQPDLTNFILSLENTSELSVFMKDLIEALWQPLKDDIVYKYNPHLYERDYQYFVLNIHTLMLKKLFEVLKIESSKVKPRCQKLETLGEEIVFKQDSIQEITQFIQSLLALKGFLGEKQLEQYQQLERIDSDTDLNEPFNSENIDPKLLFLVEEVSNLMQKFSPERFLKEKKTLVLTPELKQEIINLLNTLSSTTTSQNKQIKLLLQPFFKDFKDFESFESFCESFFTKNESNQVIGYHQARLYLRKSLLYMLMAEELFQRVIHIKGNCHLESDCLQ